MPTPVKGKWLFSSYRKEGNGAYLIDENKQVRFLGTAASPGAFAPDGKSFVYSKGIEYKFILFDCQRNKTKEIKTDYDPGCFTWSPDGTKFAYVGVEWTDKVNKQGEPRKHFFFGYIYIYDLSTGEHQLVWSGFREPKKDKFSKLRFSPDGSKLLFYNSIDNRPEKGIYLLDIAGNSIEKLYNWGGRGFFWLAAGWPAYCF